MEHDGNSSSGESVHQRDWQSPGCTSESSASSPPCAGRTSVIQYWNSVLTASVSPETQRERESGVLVTADAAADKPTPEVQPASADDAWQLSEFSGWWFDPCFSPIKHVRARSKSTTYREQSIFGDRISSKICYTNHLCKDSGLLKYSIFHSISFRAGLQLFMIL